MMAKKRTRVKPSLQLAFCSKVESYKQKKTGQPAATGLNCYISTASKPTPCKVGYEKGKCYTRIMIAEGLPTQVTYRRHK